MTECVKPGRELLVNKPQRDELWNPLEFVPVFLLARGIQGHSGAALKERAIQLPGGVLQCLCGENIRFF